MSKLLDQAIDVARALPSGAQDEIARAILTLAANDSEPEAVDPAHLTALLEALEQADRREFVSGDEVEAAFRRFDG